MNNKLLIEAGALRQYKHNDGSDGFFCAWDLEITNRVVAYLEAELCRATAGNAATAEAFDEAAEIKGYNEWAWNGGAGMPVGMMYPNDAARVAWVARAKLAGNAALTEAEAGERDSALRAEPAGQHGAGFHGTIDAGEYSRETGMMRVTVKLPFKGLPEALLTINGPVFIATVEQSEATRCRAEGGVTCNNASPELATPAATAAPGDLPPLPQGLGAGHYIAAEHVREYGAACWALGRGAAVRDYVLPVASNAGAAPGWISVDDERKPEPGKPVLLFVRTAQHGEDDNGHSFTTEGEEVAMGEYCWVEGWDAGTDYFDCYTSPMSDSDWITHWMSLPAAPSNPPVGAERKAP